MFENQLGDFVKKADEYIIPPRQTNKQNPFLLFLIPPSLEI